MNFRKSPPSLPQDVDESPFESSILAPCAASIRACSLLAVSTLLSPCETLESFIHPPSPTLRGVTETPTFARAGEDNWIPTKLGTVVSRNVSGIRERNSCLAV